MPEGFSKNQDIPSDAALKEDVVRSRKHLQHLHNLNNEILGLEQRLVDLKTKRTEIQQHLTPYAILDPFQRLPTDILREIFPLCLPTNQNPIIKTNECLLLLTQICSRWRAVAILDLRLWSRLYITFSDDDLIPVGGANGLHSQLGTVLITERSKRRAVHVLRTRIDAVKEWLLCSGSRPLSISLRLTCNLTLPEIHSNNNPTNDMALELLQFLASISSRFESLELHMPIQIYCFFEDMMIVPEMKILKSFKADYRLSNFFSRPEGRCLRVGLLSAPNLQKISMSGSNLLWGSSDPSQDWSKVTHVACHQAFSIPRVAYLLKKSPNLVFFQATIRPDNEPDLPPYVFRNKISLPFLRSFHITESLNPSLASQLYDFIDAPYLHSVSLMARISFNTSTQNPPSLPIMALLSKLSALKRLTIDTRDNISRRGIDRLILAAPTVTHLTIGTAPPPQPLSGAPAVAMTYRTKNSPWDICGLLDDPRSKLETDPPLLPNLESLDVSVEGEYFSDEKLRDFVIGRLDPSSPHGIAPLKHVRVNFFRDREMDVEEEIWQHAGHVGVDIDLELHYHDLHNPQPWTFSPAYGLRIDDGRSWTLAGFDDDYR